MKRSDAILKISCNLWGKNIPTNSKELAELVITLAEEVGMKPPLVGYNVNNIPIREWESEISTRPEGE